MKYIDEASLHPDLLYRDRFVIRFKIGLSTELEQLSLEFDNATSSAELNYLNLKKLELFRRIFGF